MLPQSNLANGLSSNWTAWSSDSNRSGTAIAEGNHRPTVGANQALAAWVTTSPLTSHRGW